VSSVTPLVDEGFYIGAFRRVAAGASPYAATTGFYYPPSFAVAGAALSRWIGEGAMLVTFRTLNLAGLGYLVWASVGLIGTTRAAAAATAIGLVALAPGVALGLRSGNLSLAVSAALVWALLEWPRRPAVAGALVGASVAVKPLATTMLPLLLLHRTSTTTPRWPLLLGGAGAAALALIPGHAHLPDYLALGATLDTESFPLSRTVSLHRLLVNLGIDPGRLAIAATVLVASLLLARARSWRRLELACLALAATTLATPVLWSHTLLVTLPVQALALRKALRVVGSGGAASAPTRDWSTAGLVVACILSLHLANGVGSLGPGPSPWIALALAPPVFATTALASWLLRTGIAPAEDNG
jgi:hypothetical protein